MGIQGACDYRASVAGPMQALSSGATQVNGDP